MACLLPSVLPAVRPKVSQIVEAGERRIWVLQELGEVAIAAVRSPICDPRLANANDPYPHRRMMRVAPDGWRTATMVLIVSPNQGSTVMKTILSALLALSVLGSVAAPASAGWDTKAFWENLEREAGGGN